MNVDLAGKIALVTGAARGIGKAAAQRLAENGATVIVADLDEPEAQRTAKEIRGAHAIRLDVSVETEVAQSMAELADRFGHLDILVNNAGVNSIKHRVPIDQFPISEWDWIVNVDLRGLFLVSRAACPLLEKGRDARVINIASVLGVAPVRLQCAFTAAKAAVVNLTRAMALELAPRGILVNCIAPGSTLTETTRQLFYGPGATMSDKAQRLVSHIPLGRVGEVGEIANAILFFSAPACSYITGQVLAVDGGWLAGGYLRDF